MAPYNKGYFPEMDNDDDMPSELCDFFDGRESPDAEPISKSARYFGYLWHSTWAAGWGLAACCCVGGIFHTGSEIFKSDKEHQQTIAQMQQRVKPDNKNVQNDIETMTPNDIRMNMAFLSLLCTLGTGFCVIQSMRNVENVCIISQRPNTRV